MEEIIIALKKWEAVRLQPNSLINLFVSKIGFELDMSLFAVGTPLHAYAAIKEGVFGFYVISEANDVASTPETLAKNCYWFPCKDALISNQEIPEGEAKERIAYWNNNYPQWINEEVSSEFGMYQLFNIPTTSLQAEKYSVFFALKDNAAHASLKAADLVLKNTNNMYFDTVSGEPPYKDRPKYYLLDLL